MRQLVIEVGRGVAAERFCVFLRQDTGAAPPQAVASGRE